MLGVNMSISNNQEVVKYRLSDEHLSLFQLLYVINNLGLENRLDINGGFRLERIIDLLSENIDIKDIEDIIDEANSVNDDLLSLYFELSQIKRKDLRIILRKSTDIHVPSSSLIEGIFLFVPFEKIKKELDYNGPTIVSKIRQKRSKKGSSDNAADSDGDTSSNTSNEERVKKPVVSEENNTNKRFPFEVDKSNLESKLLEYDNDYLLDMIFNNKECFDSIKDLSRKDFEDKILEEKITKEKLIQCILEKISYQILAEYFNRTVYEFFPSKTYKEPRDYQIETISQIYNAIENGYKYIVLEAVSGYGKSLIAATLARIYSNEKSYILTTTNQLLTPYMDLFEKYNFCKVQKRSAFVCKKNPNRKCTISSCQNGLVNCSYYSDSSCNYLNQFKKGLESDAMICTYDYFFNNAFYHDDELEHRKLLICDEGHNIDNRLSSAVSLKLFEYRLKTIKINTRRDLRMLYLSQDYYNFILKAKVLYQNSINSGELSRHNERNYRKDLKDIDKFLEFFERGENNLAFEFEDNGDERINKFKFAPVKIKKFIPDAISDYCDVCIFMSSSFFDLENFAYDLGLDESEVFKITVPNIFDLSNNPITIYDDLEMDYDNLKKGNKDKAIPIIKDILEKHKKDKGIIHTFSEDCAVFLSNNLNETRCLVASGGDREDKLEEFKSHNDNSVLISPSMDEGVDLDDDDCKFQIIFKLPYPPYKNDFYDKRKVLEDGKDWYRYKMLTRLIQAYGRGIRSEEDSCKTYILDKRLWKVILNDYENDTHLIPQYFIDAIENYE